MDKYGIDHACFVPQIACDACLSILLLNGADKYHKLKYEAAATIATSALFHVLTWPMRAKICSEGLWVSCSWVLQFTDVDPQLNDM
eukprot:481837-Amphidinium_carterae.2